MSYSIDIRLELLTKVDFVTTSKWCLFLPIGMLYVSSCPLVAYSIAAFGSFMVPSLFYRFLIAPLRLCYYRNCSITLSEVEQILGIFRLGIILYYPSVVFVFLKALVVWTVCLRDGFLDSTLLQCSGYSAKISYPPSYRLPDASSQASHSYL